MLGSVVFINKPFPCSFLQVVYVTLESSGLNPIETFTTSHLLN
jgi:hypothetical protein